MGAVYLAKDVVLNRRVALKVMLGSLARNTQQVRRFQREAQAAAPLIHPNIVRIYEAGVRSGTPFIAMEYVDGESFDQFIARTGRIEWRLALELAEQVAQALACAHANGVVHRDVKPSNILIDKKGRIRLTDFGIARVRDRSTGMTDHGQFIGTPEYMSPEQCGGDPGIGPASDLFSLGVTLYRMISGELPFKGSSTAALIAGITSDTPLRLNKLMVEVPDDVARLVARLLEKDPKHRPESAESVCEAIQNLLDSDGGTSAMPDALDAFIREQGKSRDLPLNTPTPREKKTGGFSVKRKRSVRYKPISGAAQAAAGVVAAIAIGGAVYWNMLMAPAIAEAAPRLPALETHSPQPGVTLYRLPSAAWNVAALSWDTAETRVLLRLTGLPGTAWAGGESWLVLDPEDAVPMAPLPPRAPSMDPVFAEHPVRQPTLRATGGAFAVAIPWTQSGEQAHAVALLLNPLDEYMPHSQPLAVIPQEFWGASALWRQGDSSCAQIALDSAGQEALLYLPDGGLFQGLNRGEASQSLATEERTLLPGSMRLSPGGDEAWYVCQERSRRKALCRMAPLGPGAEISTVIVSAGMSGTYALSPQGTHAVIAATGAQGAEPLLYTTEGNLARDGMAPGGIHPECWHPSGRYFLVTHGETLQAQAAEPPYMRTTLAEFSGTVLSDAAVSSGGRWAVVLVNDGAETRPAFIDLSSVALGAAAQSGGSST